MKNANDKMIKDILGRVFERTKNSFSFSVDFTSGSDSVSVKFEDYFNDTLANVQLRAEKSEDKRFAYAQAFALNAMNFAAQTREMHKQIDEYFSNENNRGLIEGYGVSEEEKTKIAKQIKDYVSDTLSVKVKTKEETAFVEKINAVFDKSGSNVDCLKDTLDYISNVNRYIENGLSEKDALNSAYNDLAFLGGNTDVAEALSGEISALTDSLDKDSKVISSNMQDITENYVNTIDNNEVSARSFSESYRANPQKLTQEEKTWAHKVYGRILLNTMDLDNGWDVFNMDVRNFRSNGKQIISDEEFESAKDEKGIIQPEKQQEMEGKIAAMVAEGEDISVINRAPEKPLSINPSDVWVKKPSENYISRYPDSLTAEDKKWAEDITSNLLSYSAASMGGLGVELTRFMADGEQIISDEEYEKNLPLEEYSKKIAERVASGAVMSIRMSAPERLGVNERTGRTVIAIQEEPELMLIDMSEIVSEKEPITHDEFAAHFKASPDNLSAEDKAWANEAFDKMYYGSMDLSNGWDTNSVKLTSFCANGKQIVSDEEFAKASPEEIDNLKAKVAFSLASGDKISVRREIEEKSVSFDVSSIKVQKEADKEKAEPAKTEAEESKIVNNIKFVDPLQTNVRQMAVTPEILEAKKQIPQSHNIPKDNVVVNENAKDNTTQKNSSYKGFLYRLMVNLVKEFLGIDLDKIIDKDKTAEKTAENSVEKPAQKTVSKPVEKSFGSSEKKAKPVRVKISFSDLTNDNTKKNLTKPLLNTNEKTLDKKGRTM